MEREAQQSSREAFSFRQEIRPNSRRIRAEFVPGRPPFGLSVGEILTHLMTHLESTLR